MGNIVKAAQRRRKLYSPSALKSAITSAKKKKKPRCQALEQKYGVPRSTLSQYIVGRSENGVVRELHLGAKSGPATALSAETEQKLLCYVQLCRRLCNALDKKYILQRAAQLEKIEAKAQKREPKWPDGIASDKWWRGYKKRHGNVLRSCQVGHCFLQGVHCCLDALSALRCLTMYERVRHRGNDLH